MAGRVRPALLIAVAVAAALGCGHAARPATPRFDAEPWIEDYLQLRAALSAGYANLEWALERRDIDPFALNEHTMQAIRRARDAHGALWALLAFVATFADPHLKIDLDAHPGVWRDAAVSAALAQRRDARARTRGRHGQGARMPAAQGGALCARIGQGPARGHCWN